MKIISKNSLLRGTALVILGSAALYGCGDFLENAAAPQGTLNGATLANKAGVEGSLIAPDSDVKISVHASHPSGLINKLELFANGESLGEGTPSGVNQYNLELRNTHRAVYSIAAVATDGSGITTTSTSVNITVNKPPTVNIINPSEGATFPSLYNINITAKASSPDGTIEKVEFYSNGVLIGTSRDVGTDRFMMTWRRLPDGVHVLTAVATDELGVTSKSPPVKISVSNPGPKP